MRMQALIICAAMLSLGGCDTGQQQSGSSAIAAADVPGGPFDYRYAYSLPGSRIKDVQESHAQGCDHLGPARCRITAIRYKSDDQNRVTAVLTIRIDPELARLFGQKAAGTVQSAGGAMTSAEIAGADSAAISGRADTVVARLRDAAGNTDAQLRGPMTPEQHGQLVGKVERLRAAIATIGEVEQNTADGVATTPMILTYTSGGAIPGVGASADASFATAGATFLSSLAGLAVVLAGVGPWALMLIGGALALRWIVQRTDRGVAAPELPPAPRDHAESRNVVQRWFGRDEHHEAEHAD